MTTQPRIPLDDLTSDALDALYDRLEAAESTEQARQLGTCREAFASATSRAARAEARVRELEADLTALAAASAHAITLVGRRAGRAEAQVARLAPGTTP